MRNINFTFLNLIVDHSGKILSWNFLSNSGIILNRWLCLKIPVSN